MLTNVIAARLGFSVTILGVAFGACGMICDGYELVAIGSVLGLAGLLAVLGHGIALAVATPGLSIERAFELGYELGNDHGYAGGYRDGYDSMMPSVER